MQTATRNPIIPGIDIGDGGVLRICKDRKDHSDTYDNLPQLSGFRFLFYFFDAIWSKVSSLCSGIGRLLLILMLVASTAHADGLELEKRDIVFYYGSRPPIEDLRHFDQIVIQPSQILPHEKTALLNLDSSLVFAYVSFGEIARNSEDMARIDTDWSIGVNPAWNSLVMDMTDPAWREYLLKQHFERLWRDGYRAFFLDTVDSYLIVTKEGKQREEQEKGLVSLLAEVKQRFPGCKLILNRGFEVLDRASQYADGMVAESLFHGLIQLAVNTLQPRKKTESGCSTSWRGRKTNSRCPLRCSTMSIRETGWRPKKQRVTSSSWGSCPGSPMET